MNSTSRFEWIRFGVYGFLLSLIGSATCGCAERMGALMSDAFNFMSLVLLGIGVIILIAGFAGAALVKKSE